MFQFVVLLFVLSTGQICAQVPNNVDLEITPSPGTWVVASNNRFGFKLYKNIVKQSDNVVFSPWSVGIAFSLIFHGAENDSLRELTNLIDISGLNVTLTEKQLSNDGFLEEIEVLNQPDVQKDFKSSTYMLVQNGINLRQKYLEDVNRYFNASIEKVNFANGAAVQKSVNDDVARLTNGMITQLLDKVPGPLTKMILLNAVYFKGNWKRRFDKNETKKETFHGKKGDTMVDMMSTKAKLFYTLDSILGSHVIELPYEGNGMSLIIIMDNSPNVKTTENLESKLTSEVLNNAIGNLESRFIDLKMPKFGIKSTIDFKKQMQLLNVSTVFDPAKADLSSITSDSGLYVDDVVHKAIIDVNEDGTEAAASTAAVIVSRAKASKITIDRPFLFVLRHMPSGANMFLGRVLNL